jgi:DNA invertase Pin-like site-specific DNA recombinase
MKAFGYVRVSTQGQASEGVSLDAQASRLAAWATANAFDLAEVFTDAGISGKRATNRPALTRALDAVCAAKGVLVVYSLSRLARSTKDAIAIVERLNRSGADLVSLTERIDTTTAAGKMIFTVFAAFAQFESDLASERTKGALAHMKSQGLRIGQIPFGSDLAADGVSLVPNASEQATLADLRAMRANGWTYQRIADELNRRGISTKTNRVWSWQTIRNLAA